MQTWLKTLKNGRKTKTYLTLFCGVQTMTGLLPRAGVCGNFILAYEEPRHTGCGHCSPAQLRLRVRCFSHCLVWASCSSTALLWPARWRGRGGWWWRGCSRPRWTRAIGPTCVTCLYTCVGGGGGGGATTRLSRASTLRSSRRMFRVKSGRYMVDIIYVDRYG